MLDPTSLYEFESYVDPHSLRAQTMVVTLTGYMDAGHSQRLLDEHFLSTLTSRKVATFDVDQLIDYRGQRPPMLFDADKFVEFTAPTIELHHVVDEAGVPFLLLSGVEPDLQWERTAAAVDELIDTFGVSTVVTLGAIPMAVPHSRPITLTKHASDSALLPGNQPRFQKIQMGSSFPAMLEFRLGQAQRNVIGITAHVPHYLAQADFPDASLALLRGLSESTGLIVPTVELAESAQASQLQINSEVSESNEAQALVAALEEQYDRAMAEQPSLEAGVTADDVVPSADELGAEAEAFLRDLSSPSDDDDWRAGPVPF